MAKPVIHDTAPSPYSSHSPSNTLLSVVMPVHNEAKFIEKVIRNWIEYLDDEILDYEIVIVNDGSTDGSGRILDKLRKDFNCLRVIHQLQAGHEQAVRRGYETCRGKFVFQVDPNGRYEPSDFSSMWAARTSHHLIIGKRTHRLDHALSKLLSRLIRFVIRFLFKCPLNEPGIAFRLYNNHILRAHLSRLPITFESVNLGLSISIYCEDREKCLEIQVPFRFPLNGKKRTTLLFMLSNTFQTMAELIRLKFSLWKSGGYISHPSVGEMSAT